jgi:hypothetical protein
MPTIDPSRPHAVLAVAGRLPDPGPGFASRHGNHDTAVISPPPSPAVAGTARPAAPRRILGAALRELREDRALRLEDAATRLGVAASTLSRIETGKAPARTLPVSTPSQFDLGWLAVD